MLDVADNVCAVIRVDQGHRGGGYVCDLVFRARTAENDGVVSTGAVYDIVSAATVQNVVPCVADDDLASSLPVPLRLAVPVSVRFSTLAPSV